MSDLKRPQGAARGTGRSQRAGALVFVGLLPSCLVTDKVDYEQPAITSTFGNLHPATEFVQFPVDADEWCERSGPGHMLFEVEINDLNREEKLTLRYVVNKQFIDAVQVPLTGRENRGVVRFCVRENHLREACNLVEALVSSSFSPSPQRPYEVDDGDLAMAHWWVIGNATDHPNASYLDCPDPRPDAGAP